MLPAHATSTERLETAKTRVIPARPRAAPCTTSMAAHPDYNHAKKPLSIT